MKSSRNALALVLLAWLYGCSGDKDNSEPPAQLQPLKEAIPLSLEWKLDTRAASNNAAYRLQPLHLGDRVYTIDTGGTVSCVDLKRGRILWKYMTGLKSIAGLGGNAESIVATSQDGDIATYRLLEKGLEPTWQIRIDSEIRARPVVDGGQIFLRSVDGKIRSLDIADGSQQWLLSRRVPTLSLTGNSVPLVQGRTVYVGFDDGKLVAIDRRSGQIYWEATVSIPAGRTEVERLVDLDGDFVMRDGILYVSSFQGRLVAIQAVSGDLLWSRQFSNFQAIAIDDNAIYLTSDSSDLWAIDRRTGAAFWKQDALHARRLTAPAIVSDRLVVTDFEGYLHWISRDDGRLVGRIRVGEERSYVQPLNWRDSVLTLDKFGLLALVSPQQ